MENQFYTLLILLVNIFIGAFIMSSNSNIKILRTDLKKYSEQLCLLQGEHNSFKNTHIKK